MNTLHDLTVHITLQAPYLVHGNDPGRQGLHATLLRDHRRCPILPGTLVAGRIAEVWTAHGAELGGASADTWFGTPGFGGSLGAGQRARLRVCDLVLQTVDGQPFDPAAPTHDFDVTRVRLDEATGSVQHGALLVVEQVSRPGARLSFAGTWQTWANADEAETLRRQLLAALLVQTQLGAWRGIGFGRVQAVAVEWVPRAAVPAPTRPAQPASARATELHRYALTTTDALCLSAATQRGNVFESVDYFTGGTLKGALARMLCERHGVAALAALAEPAGRSPLAAHFDQLRCTHALPAQAEGGRPVPLPQSLVRLDTGGKSRQGDQHDASASNPIRDAYAHAAPPADLGRAVAFQTDWKDADVALARQKQRWGTTRTHLRVRTDIDASGRAKTGALFAYECKVAPLDTAGQPQTRWLFDVDLAGIPAAAREAVRRELDELFAQGLAPLGKTDAAATVTPCPVGPVWHCGPPQGLRVGQLVPLLLVSDAVLLSTRSIEPAGDWPAQIDLPALYGASFAALQVALLAALQAAVPSAGRAPPLAYSHHFATQRLAGGPYLHGRYGRDAAGRERPYRPLVLTEAGAVFVFRVLDPAGATAVLAHWQAHGLALPPDVVTEHGASWLDHPYLPQNGFGEVAVQPVHGFAAL